MALDSFFDGMDSMLLLFLFITTLTKADNGTTEEKLENELEVSMPEPALQGEAIFYIHKSSNRKRLKPKAVYF
ncbi:MAG: hypothetical protein ACYCYE_18260 [Clostridia bacterium]